jgi:hypothetical protein
MRWSAALLFLLCAAPASAETSPFLKPGDPVPGHPGLTWLDLVRQAVPSLAETDAGDIEGHLKDPPPRHIGGKSFEGEPPDPVTLGDIEVKHILAGGQKRMVVMADLGPDPDRVQSQTLLLLFNEDGKPKLLDVVDVGLDKDTVFDDPRALSLGPGDDALVTVSEHDDSDLAYDGRVVLFVRNDRFRLIADFYAITEQNCGWRQDQTPRFTTRPDPGSPYRALDIAVVHKIAHVHEEGCGDPIPRAVTRTYEALYRWDAKLGRFTTASTALKRLDKLNGVGP